MATEETKGSLGVKVPNLQERNFTLKGKLSIEKLSLDRVRDLIKVEIATRDRIKK